jgi:hypothetical protein
MVLVEFCLIFSVLLFGILALLQFLSFNFAFAFGFIFLAVFIWYLFEHFHTFNFPYTYEIYDLLMKVFYFLLVLRMFFLTVIATYLIINFVFINFELFVAQAYGGEVAKVGAKVASSGSSNVHENFFRSFFQEGPHKKIKLDRLDAVVAGSTYSKLSFQFGGLGAIESMANQHKIEKFILDASREQLSLTDSYLHKLDDSFKKSIIKHLPLYDESNFMTRLKRVEPHFFVLNKVVEGKSANLLSLLYDNPFKDKDGQQNLKFDKIDSSLFLNFLKATITRSTDDGVPLYLKKPSLLFGDPARLNSRSLNLTDSDFHFVSFYQNLMSRVYPETFEVAERGPDNKEPGKGVADFSVVFKDENERTYCEGKTPDRLKSNFVGYLGEDNYFVFQEEISNYVERSFQEAASEDHRQLIHHISKDRKVAYVYNFPDLYCFKDSAILSIEEKLNEELKRRLPPRGTIKLVCSRLDDKIIQFEKLN